VHSELAESGLLVLQPTAADAKTSYAGVAERSARRTRATVATSLDTGAYGAALSGADVGCCHSGMSQLCTNVSDLSNELWATAAAERGATSHCKPIAMFEQLRLLRFCLITTACGASAADDANTGDQGVITNARNVLQLVADEQADGLIVLGDLSYGKAPPADWAAQYFETGSGEVRDELTWRVTVRGAE